MALRPSFTFGVAVANLPIVIESLQLSSEVGQKAQAAALRDTGRSARAVAVRKVAQALGIVQKVLRRRIKVYVVKQRKRTLAQGRLWMGAGRPPTAAAHGSVLAALRSKHPSGVLIRRPMYGGRVAWVTRNATGQLREQRLEVDRGGVGEELEEAVRDALKNVYPKRLRGQYRRMVRQRIRNRARGRRFRR